jgi:hypothetical protein
MSATYLNAENFNPKEVIRKNDWREHNAIGVDHQPRCRYTPVPNDFPSDLGRERGHLTPVQGNRYTEQVMDMVQ